MSSCSSSSPSTADAQEQDGQPAILLVLAGIADTCPVLGVRVVLAQAGTAMADVHKLLIREHLIHDFSMSLLVQPIL